MTALEPTTVVARGAQPARSSCAAQPPPAGMGFDIGHGVAVRIIQLVRDRDVVGLHAALEAGGCVDSMVNGRTPLSVRRCSRVRSRYAIRQLDLKLTAS